MNIHSFYGKIFYLKHLIFEHNIKLIFIVESWLHDKIFNSEIMYYFSEFRVKRVDRTSNKGGGIIILYHWTIEMTIENSLISQSVEYLHVSVEYKTKRKPLQFIVCYHIPDTSR